jgi:hypothetical protein
LWNTCLLAASLFLPRLFGARLRIVKYYFIAQPIVLRAAATARFGAFSLTWPDAQWPLFSQIDRPSSVIAARFAQRARCLAATVEGGSRLAGFLWFVPGAYEEDEVRARFRPQPEGAAVWDFDVSILPQYRMSRLFSYLWARAAAELAREGVMHSMSRISAFNGASLAAHRRLGARVVGQALFICIGRWQLMMSNVSPRFHLSWRDEQRPTLAIGPEAADAHADIDRLPARGEDVGHGAADTRHSA